MNQMFKCPLCKSKINEELYLNIKNIWEKKKEDQQKLRLQIQELKTEKTKLKREKKEAIQQAILEGMAKEKRRSDTLAKLVEKKTADFEAVSNKLKELESHLKKGTTPQSDGFDFENLVVEQLINEFRTDLIEHHGKSGDILQRIFHDGVEVGSIIYECKKTSTYSSEYVHQTKKAVLDRNANFGILLSFTLNKSHNGFFVDNEIIILHPYSTVFMVQILRKFIIENHILKQVDEINIRNNKILEFLKSNDFKNAIGNVNYRTNELVLLLEKEKREHERMWKKREQHYQSINNDIQSLSVNLLSPTLV